MVPRRPPAGVVVQHAGVTSAADALRSDIEAGAAIFVVGAGAAVATTAGAPTAHWLGLLESGIQAALDEQVSIPPGWEANVRSDLAMAAEYLPATLTAAEKVTAALGGSEGAAFKRWLREAVGGLEVDQPRLLEAIHKLGLPIATTNYDDLIEKVTGRATATWMQTDHAQSALKGQSSDVVHLHGHWRTPESVILSAYSYGRLGANSPTQALQRAVGATRTLVFAGFGAGLGDPNFGALREWLSATFRGSETRHFRLCRDSEYEALLEEHKGESLTPVSYGAAHEDLSDFIETLVPKRSGNGAVSLASSPEKAMAALCEQARSSTVFADQLSHVDRLPLTRLIVPPVLLPMTQEQFSYRWDLPAGERPKRCDPVADTAAEKRLLVAGEENSGLTSALTWFVAQAHEQTPRLTPVVVDFRSLGMGFNPLRRQVIRELMLSGAMAGPTDTLPPCAVALDNVTTKPDKIFHRAIAELASEDFPFVVLGCRQGTEADVLQHLGESDMEFSLRYIGRFNRNDATLLASLAEPARASRLASRALEIIQREHLVRTPITLGLLISVLLHGEALLGTASDTALLDAYISLLLGRGDPHDDARITLDAHERTAILATLAQTYVERNAGSLSEADVISTLADYFDSVGWSEDPVEVLTNFKARHLLTVRGGQVQFTQSSFLHLFAARRAIESKDFKGKLFARSLYYAQIIRHYAALTRDDPEVLYAAEKLILEIPQVTDQVTRSFENVTEPYVVELEDSEPPEGSAGDVVVQEDADEGVAEEEYEAWLDRRADSHADVSPFPVEDVENSPPIYRITTTLTLVSGVLRDSELVKDLPLKRRLLEQTLRTWAELVKLLDESEGYQDFLQDFAEELAVLYRISGQRRRHFIENFVELGPLLTAYGGISAALASRKLARSLDESMEDLTDKIEPAVMAAFLAERIHGPEWLDRFEQVRSLYPQSRAVQVFLSRIAEVRYQTAVVSANEQRMIEDFLLRVYISGGPKLSPAEEKRYMARTRQRLRASRTRQLARTAERKALKGSTSVIEGEVVQD